MNGRFLYGATAGSGRTRPINSAAARPLAALRPRRRSPPKRVVRASLSLFHDAAHGSDVRLAERERSTHDVAAGVVGHCEDAEMTPLRRDWNRSLGTRPSASAENSGLIRLTKNIASWPLFLASIAPRASVTNNSFTR